MADRSAGGANLAVRRAAVEALEGRALFAASVLAFGDADVQTRAADPSYANANFGADPALRVGIDPADTTETYVEFDLSGVTGVGSARVQMVGGAADGVGPVNVSIFGGTETNWIEGNGLHPADPNGGLNLDNNPDGEVHWNTRPATGGGAIDTQIITGQTVYEWDVTAFLQAKRAAGATVVAFAFRSTSGVGQTAFASKELGGGAGPRLIVEDDATAPTATVSAPAITTAGGTTQTVTVTYADAAGVDASTVGANDVVVTGPAGPLTVTGASADGSNPRSVVATYTLAAPGGTWDGPDNGSYAVAVQPGAVTDFGGNAAAGSGAFAVNIPVDTAPPTASVASAQPVVAPGGTTYTFTVAYADNVGVATGSIGTGDVTVTRPGGGTLSVTGVAVSGSGRAVTATYTVTPPGGTWDASDNGTYAIAVRDGAVTDLAGNASAAASGTFSVNIPDVSTPLVAITPIAAVTVAGTTAAQVTVTYTDDRSISASSVDATDVTVVQDGGGPLVVSLVSKTPATDAGTVVAVYSVGAPGGFWNTVDNGTYTVTVTPGAVTDGSGNGTPLAQAQFEVNVASTNAVADPTFNGGSAVSTGFVAEAMTTDAAGRVLVAGRQGDRAAGTSQAVLQRLNADGSLDTFWGEGGQIITTLGANDGFYAVTTDEKQRVVAAGFRAGELQVVRYDARGRLDRKFGEGGVALADFGSTNDTVFAVAALPGGGVLVAGSSNGNLAFARLDARGRLDASFGSNGVLLLKPGGVAGVIGAVRVRPDGTAVAAGTVGSTVVLVKLTAAGAADAAFGTAGVLTVPGLTVRTDLGGQDHSVGLAVGTDGRIVVGNRSAGGDFGVRRFNPDGTTDATFGGGDGLVTLDLGGDDDVDFVGLQGTGQIVLAGTTGVGTSSTRQLAAAVLRADGSTEPTFAAGGKFTADAGVVAEAGYAGELVLHATAATQADGRLLLGAGEAFARPTSSPVRRLVAPGSGSLGTFGTVNGRSVPLAYTDADGTRVTLTLKGGGTGEALWDGGVLDLVLTGTSAASSLGVAAKGGDKRVTLRDLRADGPLKAVTGKTADVGGTFVVAGSAGKLSLGSLTGTLAVAGDVASLAIAGNVSGAFVLAGTSLGTDGRVGGTGTAADAYAAARILKVAIGGSAASTVVRAGVDPVNGTFDDSDDRAVGGPASVIAAVSVKRGLDATSQFVAGAFGATAKIPQKVVPVLDPHFRPLPG
ncbi:MAG: conserved repeat domain protein [Phycisphaerales bacterium]|nr:conserved repeat domain protein [Phycisphaerales bacterium]